MADQLQSVLEEEEQEWQEKEPVEEEETPTTGEENKGEEGEQGAKEKEGAPQEPDLEQRLKDLEEARARLEKENKGLLGATKAERAQRQELQGRLTQLQEMLNQAMSIKKEAQAEEEGGSQQSGFLVADYDDDGNPVIRADDIKSLLKDDIEGIRQELKKLTTQTEEERKRVEQARSRQKAINGVLGRNEAFPDAYKSLQAMVGWLGERFKDPMEEQGVETNELSSNMAMDLIEQYPQIEDEFANQFPGVDIDRVVRAYDSTRDLQSALKNIVSIQQQDQEADNKEGQPKKMPENLKKIANKAPAMGGMRNQKSQKTMTLDTIAAIPQEDLENLSESELQKMLAVIERQSE